jgi:DNA primase catalytic core
MARIPDDELARLKQQTDLVALVEAAGVTLTRHGADWHGRCPFHDDKTPSLVVSPAKGLWHCLGACATGGSAIDWVMRERRVPFRRAVELLRDAPADDGAPRVPKAAASRVVAPLAPSADDAALLESVIAFYHQTARTAPEVLAYLAQRGLTHPDLIDHFRLGYANRTLAYRLPEKQVAAGAAVRGQLQRLGLLRTTGHERFTGALVVPIRDASGTVVNVYGRKLADKQREGVPLHEYLPGPQRGVFNLDGWRDAGEVILCEALIDALTFWCAGLRHVTSAYGVNGFTDELLQAFIAHGVRRVLIAFDADAAGDAAAETVAERLAAHGIDATRVVFPRGLDANAFALKVGPPEKSLGLVVQQAVLLRRAMARPRAETPAAQVLVAEERSSLAATVEPSPVSRALPAPSSPPNETPVVDADAQQVLLTFGRRRYRVRGLAKNLSAETLRVNVLASGDEGLHVDTLDLYAAKARQVFVKQVAAALAVDERQIERDVASLLLQLEALQERTIRAAVTATPAAPVLTAEQEAAGLALLRDPRLVERIIADVAAIGVVGEDANALVGYLACVSRQLDKPLAILIQSTSAAGKSTLMDALLSLMPEPDRVHYSAMTGQSLFYLGEGDLRHKILAIAEEEGVRQAAYALKLLQSQGELTIASTGKDPVTGKLVTEEYRVEGPVMLFLTTTAIDLDDELLNRCLVLTINESREQTEAIHRQQRAARTLHGLLGAKQAAAIRAVHQAAQSLLRPVAVVNPFAEALTFRSESTRMRRDHAKYLTLIDAIAFLHQHQRPVQTATVAGDVIEYIEVVPADIALANRLAHEVLGRSLDELPPQTRRVLGVIVAQVASEAARQALARSLVRFTRKDVRAVCGITDTALRVHIERLVELEYLLVHRGGAGARFVYELAFDGDAAADAPHLIGLIDVAALAPSATTANLAPPAWNLAGSAANRAPRSHPENTPLAPALQHSEIPLNASTGAGASSLVAALDATALPGPREPATQRKPNGASLRA